jgi:hypothetical protein
VVYPLFIRSLSAHYPLLEHLNCGYKAHFVRFFYGFCISLNSINNEKKTKDMAILKNGTQISGLIGGVVAVCGKDLQILRKAPRSRSVWSEKQQQTWNRFRALTDLWNGFRFTPVQQIWKIADKGQRGINLFIKTNMPAFDPDGMLIDHERLHFSAGKLPLPHLLSTARSMEGPAKIEVKWDNTLAPGGARSDDELMIMIAGAGKFSGPVATGVTRKAGSAVIQSPDLETAQAVHLSFASDKRKMYSWDQYFSL